MNALKKVTLVIMGIILSLSLIFLPVEGNAQTQGKMFLSEGTPVSINPDAVRMMYQSYALGYRVPVTNFSDLMILTEDVPIIKIIDDGDMEVVQVLAMYGGEPTVLWVYKSNIVIK